MTYLFNQTQEVKYSDSTNTQLDAVERLRVSSPTQSYWYTPTVDKDGDLRYIESFSGTGANTAFVQNISSILMTSGTDSNGSAIRISRRRHKMRPGVSLNWMATGSFNGAQTNVTKRRGMFTAFNGIFFEVTDDLYFVVRRRLIDGTLVEDRYPRNGISSKWSEDILDGNGTSELNITTSSTFTLGSYVSKTTKTISSTETHYNVVFNTATECPYTLGTKATITGFTNGGSSGYNSLGMIVAKTSNTVTFCYPLDPGTFTSGGTGIMTQTGLHMKHTWWIDFAGDRSTRIRFGIFTAKGAHVCGIIDYTGKLGTHFSNAPALSDRLEMTNTGAVSIRPTMTWSSSCINVDAELELNPCFGSARNSSSIDIAKNDFTEYAILGVAVRPGEPYQRSDLQIQSIQISDFGNVNPNNSGMYEWRLLLNPTLSAWPSPSDIGKSSHKFDFASGTTVTNQGIVLLSGYATSVTQVDVKTALNFLNLGSNIAYDDSDRVVLVVRLQVNGTGDGKIRSIINYIEAL